MGMKADLLNLLADLPDVDTVNSRKAFVTFIGRADLSKYLDWQGNNVEFFVRLIDVLSHNGKEALVAFLDILPQAPQIGIDRLDKIAALSTSIQALSEDGWRHEFGTVSALDLELNIYSYFKAAPANLRRSFDVLLADKLRGFVGRQFVFDALDEFLKAHSSGYFIIRGVPGIGKSALMAKLVNDRGYVHHFNIASQNIRSTRVFLENVSAQLIARYGLEHKELPSGSTGDSGFLVQCLGEATDNWSNRPIIVAVDALDEADRLALAPPVNALYLPYSLPEGVYIVVTTRPLDDLRLHAARMQVLDLEVNSEGNLRDITSYIEGYARREGMVARLSTWGVSREQFVTALRNKSQGNFMYLYYVLPAIEQGRFIKGTLDELPDGLVAYYQRHWRQMREGNEREFDTVYEPIVCILGVAQQPITVQQIAAWTKLGQGQVKEAIRLWHEFLEEELVDNQHRYSIYHASFQDFLKDQVDLVLYDAMIADYYLALAAQGR